MLKVQLPSKEEHVILVRLSKIQRALYTEFMNRFRDAGNSGWLGLNPLKAFCVCCKVGLGRRCKQIFYHVREGQEYESKQEVQVWLARHISLQSVLQWPLRIVILTFRTGVHRC